MTIAWLLLVSLGYPSYGFVSVPGIATEAACKQLAVDIKAGPEKEQTKTFPFWTCTPYPLAR